MRNEKHIQQYILASTFNRIIRIVLCKVRYWGVAKLVKELDFDSSIRRFESCHPSSDAFCNFQMLKRKLCKS